MQCGITKCLFQLQNIQLELYEGSSISKITIGRSAFDWVVNQCHS